MARAMRIAALALPLILAACSSTPLAPIGSERAAPARAVKKAAPGANGAPLLPPAGSGRGGYYLDDGPGDVIPPNLNDIPDAEPRIEPYIKGPNRPYSVFGKTYQPLTDSTTPFKQRGVGSWYGKKFHGQKTASGELYDMFKMTAAHPTLPLPSYARVTNLKNGAQVIVRINDRGPFHSDRIIDLSYTAALKLGYIGSGSSELEVERLLPDEITRMAAARQAGQSAGPAAIAAGPAAPAAQPEGSVLPASSQTSLPPLAANVVPAAPAAQDAALPGAYYLQFGAYSQERNAQIARTNLLASLSGMVTSMQALPVNGLYRLYAGPYASRTAAQDAAQLIRERSSEKPFVVAK
ncbi:septal ring lytic transglycosylase RlpA family protein [Oxalobacteraceae bacterium CAVE-383]|nr:septal ring lytic transglycosylase RlpA family protein [Oxalobacteraceae bacterium CAVE-383]